jgi:hypothetical protein
MRKIACATAAVLVTVSMFAPAGAVHLPSACLQSFSHPTPSSPATCGAVFEGVSIYEYGQVSGSGPLTINEWININDVDGLSQGLASPFSIPVILECTGSGVGSASCLIGFPDQTTRQSDPLLRQFDVRCWATVTGAASSGYLECWTGDGR